MKSLVRSREMLSRHENEILRVCPFVEPIMTRGQGNTLWDVDGNAYLDLMAGQFCLAFGHAYEPLNRVIVSQLGRLTNTNTLTLSDVFFDALEALREILPEGLRKTILLSTGSEAVECALRYARACQGRPGIAAVSCGYHGLTLGSQAVSSGGAWAVPQVPHSLSLPGPDWHYPPEGYTPETWIDQCLLESERLLVQNKDSLAAVIVEPFISVGGMIFPPSRYYRRLAELCRQNDLLLIVDECQTCLGRTGRWFGYQHHGIEPDIIVLAKIAGAGLPVSAVVMSDEIASKVEGKLIHFCSHQNDPLSAAILAFVIRHIAENGFMDRINEAGGYMLERLVALAGENEWVRQPRGVGLMLGFDLPFDRYCSGHNPGAELAKLLLERGVMIQAIRQGRTFRILPGFLISRAETDQFISALADGVKHLS